MPTTNHSLHAADHHSSFEHLNSGFRKQGQSCLCIPCSAVLDTCSAGLFLQVHGTFRMCASTCSIQQNACLCWNAVYVATNAMGTNAVQSPVERSPWDSTSLVSAQEHAALQAERDALQRQLNALLARSHAGDHAVRQQGEHGCLVESIEDAEQAGYERGYDVCLLYTSPSPRDRTRSRMPSSA